MPSFADSAVLFLLALVLLGPKKLPKLARELGKWMGEFRRASNEFKMQMEEELRLSEQEDRNKKIAAMEAAAPVPPVLPPAEEIPEPEHPHLPRVEPVAEVSAAEPLPIATEGELSIMPPSTGLPTPRSAATAFDNIPPAPESETTAHG